MEMNNENDYIEIIEPTPKLRTKRCKTLAVAITAALIGSPYIIALIIWYEYDIFIGFVALLFTFLVIGIIRSKMRTLAIPHHQLEYNYSDSAIATWFAAKRLCYEEIEQNFSKNPPV